MYFKFHPNRVGISVKAVHTNLLAKNSSCINLQLPIVITTKNRLFQSCIIVKRTCTSVFSKIGLIDNQHSGQFWGQSTYSMPNYRKKACPKAL